MRRSSKGLVLALVVVLAGIGLPMAPALATHPAGSCLDVEPETDTNPVGTTHQITATLRMLSGNDCTGATTTPTQGKLDIAFDITGPNDPDGTGPAGAPDLTCSINNNDTNCTVSYDGLKTGTDTITGWIDEDGDGVLDQGESSDSVQKTWTAGPAAQLDCDDAGGPDRERETNPSNAGAASSETYTCTVRDVGGNAVTAATVVNGEVENNVNDPDATDGASYGSPDYMCTTSAGTCQVTVTQAETEVGTAEICFWVGTTAEGTTLCGSEATGENQIADQSDTGNDLADQVEKTWQTPTAATRLDCSPETDTNPTSTAHQISCIARDSNNALIANAPIDFEISGVNDTDASDSFLSPDMSCVTDQNGTCTVTHGPGGTGTTATAGTTTYKAWIDTDANNATAELDQSEARDEVATPGSVAEADGTDVVQKTWTGGPATITMTPDTDSASVGTCNPFTITVRDATGAPVQGVIVDVEQRHDLAINQTANDEPAVSFCVPTSGTNPSDVDERRGDLDENPDNRGTIGGETTVATDATGQVTIGVSVAAANTSNGTGNVTVTSFFETTDNDDLDQGEPQDTSIKQWVAPAPRTIDCEPETATTAAGTRHTVVCTVRDRFGSLLEGVSVTFTETGTGDLDTAAVVLTDANGQAGVGVLASTAGEQTVTGTLTEALTAEPGTDECDRAAGDPAGASAGVCADSVAVTWIGNQPPVCPTGAICGTDLGETLVGTPGDDIIYGFGGDDTIDGGGGSDIIIGGGGNDTINGGGGSDILKGGAGDDRLDGGERSDLLIGGGGNDTLNGDGGDDILQGGGGNDVLSGGNGDDLLNGGPGGDACRGGRGRDRLKKC